MIVTVNGRDLRLELADNSSARALGVLTALGGCEAQLKVRIGAAFNVGLTREKISEALLHSAVHRGFPKDLIATAVALDRFARRYDGEARQIGRVPSMPERRRRMH